MGRLLVLGVLLAIMVALRAVTGSDAGVHDPLVLAAIGFVVLASYSAARLGALLSLPRVSGYITAGLLLGPSAGDVLSAGVVQDLTMFNTLALGLIATGAGLELDMAALRALLRTLLVTVSAKVLFTGGLVLGGFVVLERVWHPLGPLSTPQIVAIGAVLGTLAIGTSPAIALALINETRARGRLADLTLGAAVLKDLVLVVLLAIVLALCANVLGQTTSGPSIAWSLARELGGSVALGGWLGALILVYVRFVGAEMLLFVAGLVLAASELSHALHLDLLLVFICAGFVVRNFSSNWQQVHHAIETVALPVFVVFFTIAGARIDAQATLALLPMALALGGLRAIGFFIAARIGAHAGGESANVRRFAWQAYLPQAGVTLSLLGLAVESLGPELGTPLSHIGIACVAVNLIVGPVTLRRALQFSSKAAPAELLQETTEPIEVPAPRDETDRADAVQLTTGNARMDAELQRLYRALHTLLAAVHNQHIVAYARAMTVSLVPTFEAAPDSAKLREQLRLWSSAGHAEQVAKQAERLAQDVLERLVEVLEALPARLRDPIRAPMLESNRCDGRWLRLHKYWLRLLTRLLPVRLQRRVQLKANAYVALGPALSILAVQLEDTLCRQHARLHASLLRLCQQPSNAEDTAVAISTLFEQTQATTEVAGTAALHRGFGRLVQRLQNLDRLGRRPRDPAALRARASELVARGQAWTQALGASEQGLLAATALAQLSAELESVLDREVLLPLAEAADAIEPAVDRTRRQLKEALAGLRERVDQPSIVAQLREQLQQALSEREHNPTTVDDRFRAAAAMHALIGELRALIDALPNRLSVLAEGQDLLHLPQPALASVRHLDLRARAQRELAQDFISVLDQESRQAAAAVKELDARVLEAQEMALSVASATRKDTDDLSWHTAVDSLELALDNLQQGTQRARAELIGSHDTIAAAFQTGFERLQRSVQGAALDIEGARQALARPLQLLSSRLKRAADAALAQVVTLKRWLLGSPRPQLQDAQAIAPQQLRRLFSRQCEAELPASYARLFRLEPSQDLRHTIVRENALDLIGEAERSFNAGGPSSVLIIGDAGSGRSTLLNRVQMEVSQARLLRPEAARSRRREGLMHALAYELRCASTRTSVIDALRAHKTAVLVDDLEQWLAPDASGVAELRALLSLFRQTRKEVFWVVTAGSSFVGLVRPAVAVEEGFGHVLRIAPFTLPELQRAIELRHALSGLTLVVPELLGKLPGRIVREFDRELVFSLLHSLSGGNPSAALSLWSNGVRVEATHVHVLIDRLLSLQLDYARTFDAIKTAVLVQLARFGPLSAAELTSSLHISPARIQPHLVALQNAGLLEETAQRQLGIAPSWRATLAARLPPGGTTLSNDGEDRD